MFAFPPHASPLLQRASPKHDAAIPLFILPGLNHGAGRVASWASRRAQGMQHRAGYSGQRATHLPT